MPTVLDDPSVKKDSRAQFGSQTDVELTAWQTFTGPHDLKY